MSEDDSQKLAAAKKILMPARRLGGFIISGPPKDGSPPNFSGWFMHELVEAYAPFLPQPGLDAIIGEMELGNERSFQACAMLLSLYGSEAFKSGFAANLDVKLSEHLAKLAADPDGRAKLQRLEKAYAKWADQLEPRIRQSTIRSRMVILELLGQDLSRDEQVTRWAKERLASARNTLDSNDAAAGKLIERSPIDGQTALKICQALPDEYSEPLLLGLLERVPDNYPEIEAQLTKEFQRMAQLHPDEAAQAVVTHLKRSNAYVKSVNRGGGGMGMGMSFGLPLGPASSQRLAIAKDLLLSHKTLSLTLLEPMLEQFGHPDSDCIFSSSDLHDLLRSFALRMERESLSERSQTSGPNDALAIYLFAYLGFPENQQTEAIEALVNNFREWPPILFAKKPWNDFRVGDLLEFLHGAGLRRLWRKPEAICCPT